MKHLLILILTSICVISYAEPIEKIISPFNNQAVELSFEGNYSFIVSGHFHGGGANRTGFPTNTLLANLDWINTSKGNMLISLGDLFLDVTNDIPNYEASLFSKLNKPMFNAVGNHDLTGNVYQENYGETYFYFILNNDIHIVLDTEIDDGAIKNEQLNMLKEVESLVETSNINNVFIYSHRTIWSKTYSELDLLFQDNTQSTFGNNFESDVLPILKNIKVLAEVYWFSGSLGDAPASFFQFDDENGIKFVATAIRGLPRDAVLIVNVINGEVSFDTKSFTNQELLPFEDYNVEFWNENKGKKPFNYRLLPLYIKQTLLHPKFWYGFSLMLIISLIFYWRRKKKKINL